ncbi:hypothetical protein C8F04DRAFT_1248482 [Mycena alexandri]|uniref:Uncharacterized protein n=1 Tax=Mycena alexandri TaxID=1745969 RepID=A0AAD6TJ37_9AGAR|nr:hypothetical protein C8F04DRAFT_1248482 [Mycena alexandri]
MPAHTWTNAAQFNLLSGHLPEYSIRHAQRKTSRFWPVVFEDFLRQHPVDAMLGIDKANATPEEWSALQEAILMKKSQIKSWFRYQHKKTAHRSSASSARSSQSALAKALFSTKPSRQRAHRATEVFQKRHPNEISAALAERGHDELNEEHMAVDGEDLAEQEARTKVARGERLRMRNVVVKELLQEASESEREAIAETIRLEKEKLESGGDASAQDIAREERQLAIDDSNDVMEKVLKTLADKTGWFSFAIWGGPNPRQDGRLSLKCAVYGNTPAGNDFIAQHASYEEAISLPFQEFLRRCFENGAVRPPINPSPDDAALDDLITIDAREESTAPQTQPQKSTKKLKKTTDNSNTKKRPKRLPKPKKAVAPTPAPSAAVTPPAATPSAATPPASPPADEGIFSGSDFSWNHSAASGEGNEMLVDNNLDMSMDDISSSSTATEPLSSATPSTHRSTSSFSAPVNNYWPEGMAAPTSPETAGRVATIERGGMTSTASYVAAMLDPALASIDPALVQSPSPPRPRPCFQGAKFSANRAVGRSVSPSPLGGGTAPPSFQFDFGARYRMAGPSAQPVGPSSRAASRLPGLFDTFRKHVAVSPARAYRDQLLYQQQLGARPRADIFGLSVSRAPTTSTSMLPGSSSTSTVPTPSSASTSTVATPSTVPASSVPAAPSPSSAALPASSAPAAPSAAPAPAHVYTSRPMANPTKAEAKAAKAAKAAVTGNSASALVAAAKKRGGRKRREILTDITNDTAIAVPNDTRSATSPATGSASRGSGGNAAPAAGPTGGEENVQVCVAGPSGMRAELRRQKEAEKRAKERETEERLRASRMHNPDGNHDLVCVPPLRRSGRDSRVPPRPDEGFVGKVAKTTRGELGGRQGPQGLQLVPRGGRANAAPAARAKAASAKPTPVTTKTKPNVSVATKGKGRGKK